MKIWEMRIFLSLYFIFTIGIIKSQVLKFQSVGTFGCSQGVTSGGSIKHAMSVISTASQGPLLTPNQNEAGFFWGDLDLKPAVQANTITTSGATAGSVILNFTRGNGQRRIILVKENSAVSSNPADGVNYTANSNFGSGSQIGSGNYVVFDGIVSDIDQITVTGLNLTTTKYYFKVFEYNGKHGANVSNVIFQTVDAALNPLASPPITAASALNFQNVTKSSFSLGWTNGNGDSRILIAKADNAVDANPSDGQSYSGSTSFGGGTQINPGNFVILDGSGNSTLVTSLSPNTEYFFKIVEYNGAGANANYAVSATASQRTLTNEPVPNSPTNYTQTSFTANWQEVDGANFYHIDLATDAGFSAIVNSPSILASSTSEDFSSLSPGTTYYYRVRAENSAGQSENSSPIEALTIPPTPLIQGSTNIMPTSFTSNWSSAQSATNYFLDVATDLAFVQTVSDYSNKSVANVTIDVTGLTPGTRYYVKVRSQNASGISPDQATPFEQITITNAPAVKNPSNEQSVSFKANWDAPIGIVDDYELVVATESNFANIVFSQEGIPTTNQIVTGLNPTTVYYYIVRARNDGGYSAYSSIESVLTLNADGTVSNPPLVSHGNSTQTSVAASHSGGFGSLYLQLKHRPIAGNAFEAELASLVNGASSLIPVSTSWLDQMGMEYYFVIEDDAGRKDSTSTAFIYRSFNSEPISTLSGIGGRQYRMFSIPLDPESNRVEDVLQTLSATFGGYDKSKWRLFHYQTDKYIEFQAGLTTIDPGRGYWLITNETISSVPVSGGVVNANQSTAFQIALVAGWNQIGNPYPFNIDWNQIKSANSSAGLNSLMLFENGDYTKKDVLAPWKGAFVFSDNGGTLTFPVTAKTSASGRKQSHELEITPDEVSWMLPLTLKVGETSHTSGVGMHPEAKSSKDRFDEISIPRFIDYLEMNTEHREFFTPYFSVDVVPSSNTQEWNFAAHSNLNATIASLKWDVEALSKVESRMALLDLTNQTFVDMKSVGFYEFAWRDGTQLKVLYSRDKDLQAGVNWLGQAFPNPFQDRITIPFLLSKSQDQAEVLIYDLLGRKVRLIQNSEEKSGVHYAEWDGKSDQGLSVDGGLYIYQLRSSDGLSAPKKLIKQ